MQFVKGKPPETQYATRPGARAKRREVALGRPGLEPWRIARMAEFKAIPTPLRTSCQHVTKCSRTLIPCLKVFNTPNVTLTMAQNVTILLFDNPTVNS
jgi:hypothetical protein